MVLKVSRKKSTDSKQEQLRQSKDDWNKEVSALIAHFISLKRGLNGRGDSDNGLPPSSIKDPVPEEVVSFLSGTNYKIKEVIDDAKSIVNEQLMYSQNRKKALQDILLLKEGSNILTRLKSKFFNTPLAWWNNDKALKLKLKTINLIYTLQDKLEELDLNLSSGRMDNTPIVILDFANILGLYRMSYLKVLNRLKSLSEEGNTDKKQPFEFEDNSERQSSPERPREIKDPFDDLSEEPLDVKPEKKIDYHLPKGTAELTAEQTVELSQINKLVKFILNDIEAVLLFENIFDFSENEGFIGSIPGNFRAYIRKIEKAKDQMKNGLKTFDEFKSFVEETLFVKYEELLDYLKELTEEKDQSRMSIKLIFDRYIERQELNKTSSVLLFAKNNFKRNINRWLNSWSFDELRIARVDLAKKTDGLAKLFNNLLDVFEDKNSTITSIEEITKQINKSLIEISADFHDLAINYNIEAETSKFKNGKPLKKIEDKIINYLVKFKENLG